MIPTTTLKNQNPTAQTLSFPTFLKTHNKISDFNSAQILYHQKTKHFTVVYWNLVLKKVRNDYTFFSLIFYALPFSLFNILIYFKQNCWIGFYVFL